MKEFESLEVKIQSGNCRNDSSGHCLEDNLFSLELELRIDKS